ncbi:MAG: SseB family protein, partial [Pseudomonadota bacterium]
MTPEITPQMTSRTTALAQLYAAALQSDAQADWQAVWQALAGTRLVVPLEDGDGDTVRPRLVAIDGQRAVQGFESMDLFARLLDAPGEYAEVDGAELCEMLAAQDTGLAVSLEHYDAPLLVGREAVQWIATTFRAEVSRGMNDGVSVVTP